jgi:hypothetical protein
VLARIPHDLGRCVETHRLGIEEGGAEHVRVMALHPGRGVDEEREARGVAFGKSILPEAFDLAEAALGEVPLVAAGDHSIHHLGLESADRTNAAEGGHGAAELVGLPGLELGRLDGDPHRLLLEQRDAERLAEHFFLLIRGAVGGVGLRIDDLLQPLSAAEIGMHHVALDRPGRTIATSMTRS